MSSTPRQASVVLLAAAQAVAGACALPGPGTPSKHDIVKVQFDPPEAVTSEGDTLSVRSVVGEAWRVSEDSVRVRVHEATASDRGTVPELTGRVVTVGRDRVGSILVLDRDPSGEFMAGAVVVWVVASLLGLRWMFAHAAGG